MSDGPKTEVNHAGLFREENNFGGDTISEVRYWNSRFISFRSLCQRGTSRPKLQSEPIEILLNIDFRPTVSDKPSRIADIPSRLHNSGNSTVWPEGGASLDLSGFPTTQANGLSG